MADEALTPQTNAAGAAAATLPATATATHPAAPPAAPATAPEIKTITVSANDYQELLAGRARLAEIEAQRQKDLAEAQRREFEAQVEKGQVREALTALRQQSQQEVEAERIKLRATEERAKRYALDGELSRALAAQPLVSPAAAEQLSALWRGQLAVEAQGDSFVVRTPTLQPVSEFVAQQLARPEFAHFVRAGTQGGAGGQTTQSTATPTGTPAPTPQPKTMGEAVILHMQSLKQAGGDPHTDLSQGFGLRRKA